MQQRMQKIDMMTLEFSKEHFCMLDEHKGAHNHLGAPEFHQLP